VVNFFKFENKVNAYYPVLFLSDYWTTSDKFIEINSTVPELNLTLNYQTYGQYKFLMTASMDFNKQMYE
jgi:hypothetical protein